jgi:hypothetical protein
LIDKQYYVCYLFKQAGDSINKKAVFVIKESCFPDKAKPFERMGRKAAGLISKMAELPKDKNIMEIQPFLC